MKILIVNTYDIEGGAARAAYRLHRALLNESIDSQMLVQSKSSADFTVSTFNLDNIGFTSRILRRFEQKFFNSFKNYPHKTKTLFSTSSLHFSNIVDAINKINPDIVHLHWICNEMIKIEDIAKIKAPIVWSLHDNWAFTGGCHIMWECEKYKNSCGTCPRLGSNKENDLSRKVWSRKQKTFSTIDNMTIVGLSKWLNNCSKDSTLLGDKKHINLPNPIDTTIFKPFDKEKSRKLWNLPKDKKLVLFGAMSSTNDINKGFKELSEALHKLQDKSIEFVVFGSAELEESQNFGFKTHYLGHLYDNVSLVTLYSAVDVMVVPSLQEAFGQTASEALACATPAITFGHTGLLDIVDHKTNGYLAIPFDSADLARGIEWILNAENYDELCTNAREKVLREFDSVVVAKKYIELYTDILDI